MSLTKHKLFFTALTTLGALCWGILQANAFGITPDPAIFSTSTTTFSYYTNAGEYAVQFRKSGFAQQRIGFLLSPDSQNGTLLSQSGGEPIGTLDIVFLDNEASSDYCVTTTYLNCINTQTISVIGQKQIVWNPATATTTTSTPTSTPMEDPTTKNLFIFSFLWVIVFVGTFYYGNKFI